MPDSSAALDTPLVYRLSALAEFITCAQTSERELEVCWDAHEPTLIFAHAFLALVPAAAAAALARAAATAARARKAALGINSLAPSDAAGGVAAPRSLGADDALSALGRVGASSAQLCAQAPTAALGLAAGLGGWVCAWASAWPRWHAQRAALVLVIALACLGATAAQVACASHLGAVARSRRSPVRLARVLLCAAALAAAVAVHAVAFSEAAKGMIAWDRNGSARWGPYAALLFVLVRLDGVPLISRCGTAALAPCCAPGVQGAEEPSLDLDSAAQLKAAGIDDEQLPADQAAAPAALHGALLRARRLICVWLSAAFLTLATWRLLAGDAGRSTPSSAACAAVAVAVAAVDVGCALFGLHSVTHPRQPGRADGGTALMPMRADDAARPRAADWDGAEMAVVGAADDRQ
jgi:hypothetical protein